MASAKNTTLGVLVGVTYGTAEPTATAQLLAGAQVSAAGTFQLTARTNTVLDVSVTTSLSPSPVNIDVAYGRTRAAANATVAAGSSVMARSATVSANASSSLNTSAGGLNASFGPSTLSGGVGIAVTDYSSRAVAQMDGTLTTTTGDALVTATATNTANSTSATASVLSVTRSIIGGGKTIEGITKKVRPLVDLSRTARFARGLQYGGELLGTLVGGGTNTQFAAAGIAAVTSELIATARVGGQVTVPGNLTKLENPMHAM